MARSQHRVLLALSVLALAAVTCVGFDLSSSCPGNLVINGGFEEPNTMKARPSAAAAQCMLW